MARIGRPRKPITPTAYEAGFRSRVRIARELFSNNAADMARALGIEKGTYNRYETRTMLPHYLIPKFIRLTGVPLDWLINGPAEPDAHFALGEHPDSTN